MNGRRIIESMKEVVAISRGELSKESCEIHIPEIVDVKAIRQHMGLSQPEFAHRYG
jgi:putative transcriptional regulator